jgi:hypothetical protein
MERSLVNNPKKTLRITRVDGPPTADIDIQKLNHIRDVTYNVSGFLIIRSATIDQCRSRSSPPVMWLSVSRLSKLWTMGSEQGI